jgi:regulator of sigma E protease
LEKLWITVAGVLVNFIFAIFTFIIYLAAVSNIVPLPNVIDYDFVGTDADNNIVILSDAFRLGEEDTGIVLGLNDRTEFESRADLIEFLRSVEGQDVKVELFRNNQIVEKNLVLNGEGIQSNLDLDFFPGEAAALESESDVGRLILVEFTDDSVFVEQLSEDTRQEIISSYLLSIEGVEIFNIQELNSLLEEKLGEEVTFEFVTAEAETVEVNIKLPEEKSETGAIIGAALGLYDSGFNDDAYLLQYDNSITGGVSHTINVVGYNMKALGVFIGDAFAGEPDNLVGNVGSIGTVGMEVDTIIGASFDVGPQVFVQILNLMGVISAILAFMNILPIPLLDGGNVVFILIEGITGKELPERFINILYMIFFGLIILLSVVLIGLDIIKILG